MNTDGLPMGPSGAMPLPLTFSLQCHIKRFGLSSRQENTIPDEL